MGGTAYQNLSQILTHQRAFAEIYEELGKKFAACVEVLSAVKHAGHYRTNVDLLRLYEQWLETGSERLGSLLQKEGISLAVPSKTSQ